MLDMKRRIILVIWESVQTTKVLFSEATSVISVNLLKDSLFFYVIDSFHAVTASQSVLLLLSVVRGNPS